MLQRHRERPETLRAVSVEAYRRLRVRVPGATLTTLERLDAGIDERANDGLDSRV
jgi:hypothetical protein